MKPTHYYLDCGHATQTKNKLQAEFSKYLHELNGKLIDAVKLSELKKSILEKQAELNAIYSRCTPLNITFWAPSNKDTLMISGFGFVCFYLRAAHYESN